MEELPRSGKVEVRSPKSSKSTTRIDAAKYWAVRHAILKAVPISDYGMPMKHLSAEVARRLPEGIPGGGSIDRYTMLVKDDLVVRGLIERVPGSRPQRLLQTG